MRGSGSSDPCKLGIGASHSVERTAVLGTVTLKAIGQFVALVC